VTMWLEIKAESSFDVCVLIYLNYIYIYICFILLAHPIFLCLAMIMYCVTREQMMLQVDLVRHRARAGPDWENFFSIFTMF